MKKKWLIRCGILVIILGLIPLPYTVVPAWRIQLFYADRQPAIGKQVLQQWEDSSALMFSGSSMEELTTDSQGFVAFPERRNYAPQLLRAFSYLMSTIDFW